MLNMTTAWLGSVFGRRRIRIRTNHTIRIRTFFFLLVILGSMLFVRIYIRHERMLVFLDTYNALLVRENETNNNWFLDQPSLSTTPTRTTTNKSVRSISTLSSPSLSSSLSSSLLTTRRNLVPFSSFGDDDDDNDNNSSDTIRGKEEGDKKGEANDHRSNSERQLSKRRSIQHHAQNNSTGIRRSHHKNTSTIDVRDDNGSDDHNHNHDHDHDTTNNIAPITGNVLSQEEEEKEENERQQQQQQQSPLRLSQPQSQSQPQPQPQPLLPLLQLDHRPTDNNTAIMLVAMGKVSNTTWLTERCILSIRTGGQFTGYIIVITDKEGYAKYSQTVTSIPIHGNNNNYHDHDQ